MLQNRPLWIRNFFATEQTTNSILRLNFQAVVTYDFLHEAPAIDGADDVSAASVVSVRFFHALANLHATVLCVRHQDDIIGAARRVEVVTQAELART